MQVIKILANEEPVYGSLSTVQRPFARGHGASARWLAQLGAGHSMVLRPISIINELPYKLRLWFLVAVVWFNVRVRQADGS